MANPKIIPTLKRPTTAIPTEAMASFVLGTAQPEPQAAEVESPAIEAAAHIAPSSVVASVSDTSSLPSTNAQVLPLEHRSSASTPRPRRSKASGRRVETRASGAAVRKVTVYLDPELDKKLSIFAVTHDLDRSAVVVEALSRHLRRND